MVAAINATGDRYGRLVAIRLVESAGRRRLWLFQCDCGTEVTYPLERVRGGLARSCGCLRRDVTRARSLTHGHRTAYGSSRTLRAYQHAKGRCFNPNDPKFPQYGGRGISMSPEWSADFRQFLHDMGECLPGLTLDRINVHGHYEVGNCRWATAAQQARTRTDNVWVVHNGSRMVLKDFATLMGVSYRALHARVRYRGQDPHEAAAVLLK